ncbi:efflux RND transporter periplasmic adaptor subunit [Paraburkholderia sp.]|uniref:efflux RND transporter periplasmic adaptor subunit n=1 Tax=Paraburkholderia sp. TaxID=1926495 RepID=UPI002388C702|nr:efflux RND transporter periplasmic adaptor subunit [Paraburkholderia sp.]MDE1179877.1 efflux RND transporter periplasmic adaptor subunit [Paraburkholderia sp.]
MPDNRLSMLARRAARFVVTSAAFTAVTSPIAFADDPAVVAVQTTRVERAIIAQPVRAYGIVAASASNVTTINLPYAARIVQMRVQAGQTVTRGMPLFVVQADPAAVVAAGQARSAATLAQGELARTQSLFDKELATQTQLATARKAALDAQQALAAQDQMGVTTGTRTVLAPIDGVVLQLSAAQGDQVQPGAPLLQLAAANSGRDMRANVMLGVEPADVAALKVGDTLTMHGLSTSLARSAIDGRVVMVGASVDAQSQLVNIGANVPLGQTAFIPGTRVSADIATHAGTHWIVPRDAVLKDEKGAYVFQIAAGQRAHRVAVSTQVEDGDRYGVDGSLDAALPLVVSGNYELKDGMAVRTGGSTGQ